MKGHSVSGFTSLSASVADWVFRAFGARVASDPRERAKRVLEEALELCQAEGVTREECTKLVTYVYLRPVGLVSQEAAGVGFCLMAYAEARNLLLIDLIVAELNRVDTPKMITYIRRKHDVKVTAGISMGRDI